MSFERLRTALARVPLATSGAVARLVEDPARTVFLAQRVLPRPLRVGPGSQIRFRASRALPQSSVAAGDHGTSDVRERNASRFWQAVAEDRYDEASALVSEDPIEGVALARLGGDLRIAESEGVALAADTGDREGRRRARRVARLARRDLAELAEVAFVRRAAVVGGDTRRPLHVVTNSLPEIQAGYTIRTDQIVRAQAAAGLTPHVVTRPGFPVLQGHLEARADVSVNGVAYHRLLPVLAPSRRPAVALRQHVDELAKLTRRLQPGVLHAATGFANGQAALGVRDITGTRVVYEVRGFLEDSWASRHGGSRAEATDRYVLARQRETDVMIAADSVVTLGEAMRAEIAGRGVPADRIVVVPNGVDDHFLSPLVDKERVRTRLGIPAAELVVGLISTLYPHEGVLTLVRAAALLRDQGVDIRLVIVGDGPDSGAMRALAAQMHLGDRLTAPGQVPVSDVRDWFDALDVFALPRIDSRVTRLVSPLKPVEAMARAVPVVASDLPALVEVTGADERGVRVRPDDALALAEGLGELLDDRRRTALGSAAREWVTGCRTWAYVTEAYASAYAGSADG